MKKCVGKPSDVSCNSFSVCFVCQSAIHGEKHAFSTLSCATDTQPLTSQFRTHDDIIPQARPATQQKEQQQTPPRRRSDLSAMM